MSGYSAAPSAHRRGHSSISACVDTLISAGGTGHVVGVRTRQCVFSSFMLTMPPSAELLDELLRREREVSTYDQFVLKVDGQRRGVLLDVLEGRVHRLVGRQRAVQPDREAGAARVGHEDGRDDV